MFWRAVRSIGAVAFAWAVVTTLPDMARWLRMREM